MVRRARVAPGIVALVSASMAAGIVAPTGAHATVPGSTSALALIGLIPVGSAPAQVAVSQDDTLYVTNLGSGTVSVVNPGSLAVNATIPVGAAPVGIAVSNDDTIAVTDISASSVSVINPGSLSVNRTISVGGYPENVAVGPNGAIYTPNPSDASLTVINNGSSVVDDTITVGYYPKGVAVSGDDTVYVANYNSHSISVINPGSTVEDDSIALPLASTPQSLALSSDDTVYVSEFNSATVTVINPRSLTISTEIPVMSSPWGIAVGPDDTVYVANFLSHTMSVIDGRRGVADDTIAFDSAAHSVAAASSGIVFVDQQSRDSVAVLSPVAPSLSVVAGGAGISNSITLGAIPAGYLADDSTIQSISFGGVSAAGWTHTAGTNTWTGPVPAGTGSVPVQVTFHGGQTALAGTFTYADVPAPVSASAPRDVTATAGPASAVVSWIAPLDPGSYPVTNYRVTSSPGGPTCVTSATECSVDGLVTGTSYTFTVQALTGAGGGGRCPHRATRSPPLREAS